MPKHKSILIFGVGTLQQSIIQRAKQMGLYTVGIDPLEDAACREEVDAYEVVGGQDFEGTCAVVEKYGIDGIVTSATDKPLVMMARIAEKYGFPFYSVETAQWSTDKFQMKQRFLEGGIPCAKGRLVKTASEVNDFEFPVIVKPRDNSGSRGVKLCRTHIELEDAIAEALPYSHLDTVLVEEYIEGEEYSIESLHHNGKHEVIQFTEKKTTPFPYNVELGHIQPADITKENKEKIRKIISQIGLILRFENCPSHTELKINKRGIFVIETSPRLGGDYITSQLVPLSTGLNIEDMVLNMALREPFDVLKLKPLLSGVRFFSFQEGKCIQSIPSASDILKRPGVVDFSFSLEKGQAIPKITSSLDRYGHITIQAKDRETLDCLFEQYYTELEASVF